jgi:hypothetical protein
MYKLIKHQIHQTVTVVQRLSDNAYIPFDENNRDYQTYLRWLDGYESVNGEWTKIAESNTPEPAEEQA